MISAITRLWIMLPSVLHNADYPGMFIVLTHLHDQDIPLAASNGGDIVEGA